MPTLRVPANNSIVTTHSGHQGAVISSYYVDQGDGESDPASIPSALITFVTNEGIERTHLIEDIVSISGDQTDLEYPDQAPGSTGEPMNHDDFMAKMQAEFDQQLERMNSTVGAVGDGAAESNPE